MKPFNAYGLTRGHTATTRMTLGMRRLLHCLNVDGLTTITREVEEKKEQNRAAIKRWLDLY